MSRAIPILLTILIALCGGGRVMADEQAAQADAQLLAPRLERAGYRVVNSGLSGTLAQGRWAHVRWPVQAGIDYAWLVTGDDAALDLQCYVFDQSGALIVADETARKYCALNFQTTYTGHIDAFIVMNRATAEGGAWALLTGFRAGPAETDSP